MQGNLKQASDLAVLVTNYRTASLTIDCLASFLPELRLSHCVLVVDKHSGDSSVEKIEHWLLKHDLRGQARFIFSDVNVGFAAGDNIGIRSVEARYNLVLNGDTAVKPGAFAALMSVAHKRPEAGAIGPRLEWPVGLPQVSQFGDHLPLSELTSAAVTGPVTSVLRRFEVPVPISETDIKPDWLSFACILIPGEVIDRCGLLDQGFFMYFGDAEYCHRLRQAGFELQYVPEATEVHQHGASSGVPEQSRLQRKLPAYYQRSRKRYFILAYSWLGFILANLCWTFGQLISWVRELFGRPRHNPKDKWLDIWFTS